MPAADCELDKQEKTKSASSSFLNHTFGLPLESERERKETLSKMSNHNPNTQKNNGIEMWKSNYFPLPTLLRHSFKCTDTAACCPDSGQWLPGLSHLTTVLQQYELIIKLGRLSSSRVFSFWKNLLAKSSWKLVTPNCNWKTVDRQVERFARLTEPHRQVKTLI